MWESCNRGAEALAWQSQRSGVEAGRGYSWDLGYDVVCNRINGCYTANIASLQKG